MERKYPSPTMPSAVASPKKFNGVITRWVWMTTGRYMNGVIPKNEKAAAGGERMGPHQLR